MSTLLLYLLKASLTLSGLYLVFWLFLRKDTFHQLKRFVLLGNLLTSLVLPFLHIPSLNIKWASAEQSLPYTSVKNIPSIVSVLRVETAVAENTVNWVEIAGFLYFTVAGILLLRLGIQLFSVYKLIRNANIISLHPFVLASSTRANSPFSFFRYLILNLEKYEADALSQIIQHEQIHIRQHHTLDRLISEVYTIFFWFNPFAWLHQYLLKLNLEYIADRAVLNAGFATESYQMNLLKFTLPDRSFRLTNNFNQSGPLKRIRMMNKPASPFRFRLKTAFVVPVLTGFVLLFNGTQAEKAENTIKDLSAPHTAQDKSILTSETQSLIPETVPITENIRQPKDSRFRQEKKTRIITGIIKDAYTDKPIPHGVIVSVKGKTTVSLSDAAGKFSIDVAKDDKVLVFQYVGYNTTEMAITAQNEMIVLLSLTERPAFTSSYTYLSADTVRINVKDMTDFPGENTKITGRNIEIQDSTSLLDNSVLYIIDGKKADKELVEKLEVEKIVSITVYKEEAALRKFGAEGKKGVVEIELKK